MITIKIEFDEFRNYIREIKQDIPSRITEGTNKSVSYLMEFLMLNHLRGGTSKNKLRKRTGKLESEMKSLPTRLKSKDEAIGTIEFGAEYSKVHISNVRKITTITPKTAKRLAVPIEGGPAMSGGGIKTYFGRIRTAFPFLQYAISKNNKELLVDTRGGNFIPYFVLKRFVQIQSRVNFTEIIQETQKNIIRTIYKKVIDSLVI